MTIPEYPITREEMYLDAIARGGVGGGVTVTPLSVTENGTYTAPSGTAYSPVAVNVSTPTPTLISKTVTANGTYDPADDSADGYSSVTVDVAGGGGSTGVRTLTKVAEAAITEPVSVVEITVPAEVREKSDALYIEFENVTHDEDWLYPVANGVSATGGGMGYTNKGTVRNGVITLGPLRPFDSGDELKIGFGGAMMENPKTWSLGPGAAVQRIRILPYTGATKFYGGTIRVWGYES